jgi:putative membrane protein
MLFVWRGSVLPNILPRLGLVFVIGIGAAWWEHARGAAALNLGIQPFTLLGISLAVFLGFRNSAGYERYWEARKLWGSMLNASRSLARQRLTLMDGEPAESRRFVDLIIAFAQATNDQLRLTDGAAALSALLTPEALGRVAASRFKPAMILLLLGEELQRLRREARAGDILIKAMDQELTELSQTLGGCERIHGTPIPLPYSVLLHRTIYFFCMMLPFGLVSSVGWWSPVIAVFLSYTFLALDAIGEELEEPFGTAPNDLPLNAMTRTIRDSLHEMMGDRVPPPEPVPADFIVL